MTRQYPLLSGRPRTARGLPRSKTIIARGLPDVPDGCIVDVTPAPGRTFTRYTWPPRGRGRGESLTSPRRMGAKMRAGQVIRLRILGYTYREIATAVGFSDASGAYRAYRRAMDRLEWDEQRRADLRREKS